MPMNAGSKSPHGAARYPRKRGGGLSLLVNEVYASIQGEGPETGFPTVLVRLAGCNLRCSYCDSAYAFYKGERTEVPALVERISSYGVARVLITGGEPMAQAGTAALCRALVRRRLGVSIETNGSYLLGSLPRQVVKVVDVKTPLSGAGGSFQMEVLASLARKDALKFVVAGEKDYIWSRDFILSNGLQKAPSPQLFISPVWGKVALSDLAEWVLRDRLEARVQVQLHKVIWGNRRGV
ncbi:MAG: radical SAM protein [Acidobacteria bacterium]|nr:radical SAM protein [Acidobacteriota bacterium]